MSGIAESETKLVVLREIGKSLEDGERAARAELERQKGSKLALVRASKGIAAINELVSNDLDAGTLNFESELHASSYVSNIVEKARKICVDLGALAEREELVSSGRLLAMEQAVKNVEKRFQNERAALNRIADNAAALERGEDGPRPKGAKTGSHPGPGIKAQRLAEDAESKSPPKKKRAAPKKKRATSPKKKAKSDG